MQCCAGFRQRTSSLHKQSGRRTPDQLCVRAVRAQGNCASCAGHRPFCARTHTRVPGAFTVEGAPPPPPASRPPPEWKCFFLWKKFQLFQPTGSDPSPKVGHTFKFGGSVGSS